MFPVVLVHCFLIHFTFLVLFPAGFPFLGVRVNCICLGVFYGFCEDLVIFLSGCFTIDWFDS